MDFETIQLEIANGVARLTLNRPDRLNSFTVQMHDEVSRGLEAVAKSDARVLVLTGAGRGFCAGQDLSDRAVAPGSDGVDLGESLEKRYNPLVRRVSTLDMPVICAVNGVAAGDLRCLVQGAVRNGVPMLDTGPRYELDATDLAGNPISVVIDWNGNLWAGQIKPKFGCPCRPSN